MLRLVEVILPHAKAAELAAALEERARAGPWVLPADDDRAIVRFLAETDADGELLEHVEQRFAGEEHYRVLLLAVHATLPRPKAEEPKEPDRRKLPATPHAALSREELYEEVSRATVTGAPFLAMSALSAAVAAVGLLRDSPAVIIGAMVIAPLLGPLVGLALSTALGDGALLLRAGRANLLGVLSAMLLATGIGALGEVDPTAPEVARRIHVHWSDLVVALASGGAAALALTSRAAVSLVGVMVAAALMPPTVCVGMLLGAGYVPQAAGALVLLLANVVSVHLAGTLVFRIQGIRPRTWWERERARRAARLSLIVGLVLLTVLLAVILTQGTDLTS